MKLCEYVSQIVNDPKYGHDIEWVKGNLHRAHIEQIEAAHDAEVAADYQRTIDDLAESLATSRNQHEAALKVMDQHRCDYQAEAAYRRAERAETELVEDRTQSLAEQGETEWEYGVRGPDGITVGPFTQDAARQNLMHVLDGVVRRSKAGPWQVVPANEKGGE